MPLSGRLNRSSVRLHRTLTTKTTPILARPTLRQAGLRLALSGLAIGGTVALTGVFLNRETRDSLSTYEREFLQESFQYTAAGLTITAIGARLLFKSGFAVRMMSTNPWLVLGLGVASSVTSVLVVVKTAPENTILRHTFWLVSRIISVPYSADKHSTVRRSMHPKRPFCLHCSSSPPSYFHALHCTRSALWDRSPMSVPLPKRISFSTWVPHSWLELQLSSCQVLHRWLFHLACVASPSRKVCGYTVASLYMAAASSMSESRWYNNVNDVDRRSAHRISCIVLGWLRLEP